MDISLKKRFTSGSKKIKKLYGSITTVLSRQKIFFSLHRRQMTFVITSLFGGWSETVCDGVFGLRGIEVLLF